MHRRIARTRITALTAGFLGSAALTLPLAATALAAPALPAAAATSATTSATVPFAAGVDVVTSTNLPRLVEVHARVNSVGFTVRTTVPATEVYVYLHDASGRKLAAKRVAAPTGSVATSFSGAVAFPDSSTVNFGSYTWIVVPVVPGRTDIVPHREATEVKLATLVGLRTPTRRGDYIDLVGAVRIYRISSHSYVPWLNRTVFVQRLTSSGWQSIKSLVNDGHGDIYTTVRVPFRAGIRIATPGTATVATRPSPGYTVEEA